MAPRALALIGSLSFPLLLTSGCSFSLRPPGSPPAAEKARISDAPQPVPFKPAGNVIVQSVV
jgi:hypothetical protein